MLQAKVPNTRCVDVCAVVVGLILSCRCSKSTPKDFFLYVVFAT